MTEQAQKTETLVLVEAPKWDDAKFYGQWLLDAAKAISAVYQEPIITPWPVDKVTRFSAETHLGQVDTSKRGQDAGLPRPNLVSGPAFAIVELSLPKIRQLAARCSNGGIEP
jgi:hypothetical protein